MNRHYPILALTFFLQYFVWGGWFVTLGTYLLETLGYNGREVGLVYSSTAIAATVTPFLLGRVADQRVPANRLLSLLYLSGGGLLLGVSWVEPFGWFFPLLVAYALLLVPTFALMNALAFYHLPRAARDFPRVRVWGTLGWIAAGILVSALGWEPTPYPMRMAAACSLGLGLLSFALPHTPPAATKKRRGFRAIFSPELRVLLRRRPIAILFLSLTLIAIPGSFYYSFTNPFLTEIGFPYPAGNMTWGQVSEVVLMLSLPWFLQHWRFKWVVALGLFAWGIRYVLFAYGNADAGAWMIYLGIALHGLGFNFTVVASQIWIDSQMPPSLRSTAQGFLTLLSLGLAGWVGAALAGEVVQAFTISEQIHDWLRIWWVPGGIGLLTVLGFALVFRPPRKR
jgi:nucleoside transporter